MADLKFLMWNLNKKSDLILDVLAELCREIMPDFLLLIETNIDDEEIFKLSGGNLRSVMTNKKKEIRLYVSAHVNAQMVNEEFEAADGRRRQVRERLVFFKVTVKDVKLLLVGIHFPSKFKNTSDAQRNIIRRWRGWIEAQEMILGTEKTILFGDFNLNPQEIALYSNEGLSAHPTINGNSKVKTKYYNPMWSTLGDFIYKSGDLKVPGTYFRDIGEDNVDEIHWNVLDGLLIKYSIVDFFSRKDLEIITKTEHHLLYDHGEINSKKYSDHLPVKFIFKV